MAAAHALVGLGGALPLHALAVRPLGVDGRALTRSLVRPVVGAGAALAVGATAVTLLDGSWAQLIVAGVLVSLTYAAIVIPPWLSARRWSARAVAVGGSPRPD